MSETAYTTPDVPTPVGPEEPGRGLEAERHLPKEVQELFDALREEGWTGKPFIVHGGEVLGHADMARAAERIGIADRIPRVELADVFREAGLDLDRVSEGMEHPPSDETFFEDYLRELPRHIRDKYAL